jgi:acetoin utilization deacetylase AcuC-like enzyme
VRVFYSPTYEISLPGHIWPTAKYRLVAERLPSPPITAFGEASWDDLARVHTSEYLAKLRDNRLTAQEIATLELPWQREFADAFRLMVGGTIAAADAALEDGRAAHLGGGLHHAFANHGEGFCPLNDVAVAIRVAQASARAARAAVVDLDVHHGNGTAMIFDGDETVFTFSMHQQHNYPAFKPRSDLDIGLENGTDDARYLAALAGALPRVLESGPDLIVYLAGADPFAGDRLGGLALTKGGLAERDRLVVAAARSAGVPVATVLAGGYAADVLDTVDIHANTIEAMR